MEYIECFSRHFTDLTELRVLECRKTSLLLLKWNRQKKNVKISRFGFSISHSKQCLIWLLLLMHENWMAIRWSDGELICSHTEWKLKKMIEFTHRGCSTMKMGKQTMQHQNAEWRRKSERDRENERRTKIACDISFWNGENLEQWYFSHVACYGASLLTSRCFIVLFFLFVLQLSTWLLAACLFSLSLATITTIRQHNFAIIIIADHCDRWPNSRTDFQTI